MLYKALRYMLAIQQDRSLSAAAKELGLSQSSLSMYLQRLEEQQGAALYDRKEHKLTRAGEVFCTGAKKILLLHDQAMRNIADLSAQKTFTVGIDLCVSGFSPWLVTALLRQFGVVYPDIRMQLRFLPDTELEELIRGGEIDVALCYLQSGSHVAVEQRPIMQEALFLVLPPSRPLVSQDPAALLHGLDYITMFRGSNFCLVSDAALFARNLTAAVHVESNACSLTCSLLDTGSYATVIPARAKGRFKAYPLLPLLPCVTATSGFYHSGQSPCAALTDSFMDLTLQILCQAYKEDPDIFFEGS